MTPPPAERGGPYPGPNAGAHSLTRAHARGRYTPHN